jgi:CBS domain containing-hemolysin-like protein
MIISIVVLLMSALCSGTEAALFTISELKVRTRAQEQKKSALALKFIQENMQRPIAVIVILNNIANITGGMIIGKMAALEFGSGAGIFIGVFTFLVIICAEIIPKTIGERYCDPVAFWLARPVLFLTKMLTPVLWLLEFLTWPLNRNVDSVQSLTTNESEIKMMANIGSKEGVIKHDESVLISKVLDMDNLTAADIMTPRVMMTSLNKDLTLEEVKEKIITSSHSRIVLVDQDLDDVIGIVYKTELLVAMVNQEYNKALSCFSHKVKFVPEQASADKLLRFFQGSRMHLAMVIDQYSGVAGVVSLEDVLECLTGEIVDETDLVIDLQKVARDKKKTETNVDANKEEKAI